ncbi:MAG: ATP-binding protein [Gemmataceae bacterium]|nr:ATP-binding protein [Gemmataceae bacterium]
MPDVLLRYENDFMHETSPSGALEVVIPSDPAEARRVQEEIERALQSNRFEERDIFSIKLALEEALVNAIKHGNQMDRSKKVHIAYRVNTERFDIYIADEGPGFDPEDVPDPMAVENLERPCGRGLLLMRHYMTEVVFHPPGNRVTMCKLRNGSPAKTA